MEAREDKFMKFSNKIPRMIEVIERREQKLYKTHEAFKT